MSSPLANQLRPQTLKDFVGQLKSVGSSSMIAYFRQSKKLNNLVLWGPPGTGKTTLANLLGNEFDAEFCSLNAVEIGSKLLRELGEKARMKFRLEGQQTIIFIDEIHRLNKSQQDVLLPFIEQGDFVLIGATTENPSYELNRALLSRCHLLVFEPLNKNDLNQIWIRSCHFLNKSEDWVTLEGLNYLIDSSDGDARRFINLIEILALYQEDSSSHSQKEIIDLEKIKEILPAQVLAYDKNGESHYNSISAFIKSIRGSDADAGLYYLARMLEGGEDPVFIARRLVVLASEDIGNADPRALEIAVAGADAVNYVGLPECAINLAQVVTYLASAPKSNRSYLAWKKAKDFVLKTKSAPIPLHLRSSQTTEMKKIGYGVNYRYPHDEPKAWIEQDYFPQGLKKEVFYEPSDRGFEKKIKEYSSWIKTKL